MSEISENERFIAEVQRINRETTKFIKEADKAHADAVLTAKKAKWYEVTILLAIVAATAAITKIFL